MNEVEIGLYKIRFSKKLSTREEERLSKFKDKTTEAYDFAKNRGEHESFSVLGYGCSAKVYQLTKDRVLKVYVKEDKGYENFLSFLSTTESVHLPKVYEKGEFNAKNNYVIIENLDKLSHSVCQDYTNSADMAYESNWTDECHVCVWECMDNITDSFKKTLGNLRKYYEDCEDILTWDMHDNNVMMRGDTLVVTDPWV